jgi:hypothetical protein
MTEHFHVVEFINGCLNDGDSGPIESLSDAREELQRIVDDAASVGSWNPDMVDYYRPAGEDRYVRGSYILKIEECTEDECMDDLHWDAPEPTDRQER